MHASPIVKRAKRFLIGFPLRTSNEVCHQEMPIHWEKFLQEKIASKIPGKLGEEILAVYTEYEKDHTKPYTYILGCEVTSLKKIPEGLVGITIPESKYAVFTTQGAFPHSVGQTWDAIWKSGLKRSFTCDYEFYSSDFHPVFKPEVKIFIAIDH